MGQPHRVAPSSNTVKTKLIIPSGGIGKQLQQCKSGSCLTGLLARSKELLPNTLTRIQPILQNLYKVYLRYGKHRTVDG